MEGARRSDGGRGRGETAGWWQMIMSSLKILDAGVGVEQRKPESTPRSETCGKIPVNKCRSVYLRPLAGPPALPARQYTRPPIRRDLAYPRRPG